MHNTQGSTVVRLRWILCAVAVLSLLSSCISDGTLVEEEDEQVEEVDDSGAGGTMSTDGGTGGSMGDGDGDTGGSMGDGDEDAGGAGSGGTRLDFTVLIDRSKVSAIS